jgi:hypothetical protein
VAQPTPWIPTLEGAPSKLCLGGDFLWAAVSAPWEGFPCAHDAAPSTAIRLPLSPALRSHSGERCSTFSPPAPRPAPAAMGSRGYSQTALDSVTNEHPAQAELGRGTLGSKNGISAGPLLLTSAPPRGRSSSARHQSAGGAPARRRPGCLRRSRQ